MQSAYIIYTIMVSNSTRATGTVLYRIYEKSRYLQKYFYNSKTASVIYLLLSIVPATLLLSFSSLGEAWGVYLARDYIYALLTHIIVCDKKLYRQHVVHTKSSVNSKTVQYINLNIHTHTYNIHNT